MASKYENVIVFGPTGGVGSAVALEATKRGAKVWLAMRDPKKTINKELDENQNRIQADLEDPASISKAIQTSGATAAFFYLAHHSQDGMRSTIQAMKDAGVKYVIFLSSFTIREGEDLRDIAPDKLIPYIHARVEIVLEELQMPHVALRPGSFATNGMYMWMDAKKDPYEAISLSPTRKLDAIVPADIGKIGGAVLVDRPSSIDKEIIYIFGPQLMTYNDMWKTTSEAWGKEIKVLDLNVEEKKEWMLAHGAPPPIAEYILRQENAGDEESYFPEKLFKVGSTNIMKYAGYEPTAFRDFIAGQKV